MAICSYCSTFFAYLFNTLGLKYANAALVSIYIYTQPVLATFIAITLNRDNLSVEKIIASILIFGGVALVSFSERIAVKKEHA